jgi:hypothetical protein
MEHDFPLFPDGIKASSVVDSGSDLVRNGYFMDSYLSYSRKEYERLIFVACLPIVPLRLDSWYSLASL